MHRAIIYFLLTLFCCLPTYAVAASSYTIHAEWTGYTAPTGLTVSGFKLYQEGTLACQTQTATATSLDCSVSLAADTTNFTLTAAFTDGTESPHSAPFAFAKPSAPVVSGTTTIHAEWTSYTAPSGYTVSGYNLYMEGALACQTQSPSATSMDCTVSLPADTTRFTLTAAFSNGTESPHSSPFTFTKPTSAPPQANITADVSGGTVPFAVNLSGASSTGSISSYQWNFGDGSTGTGATVAHTFTTAGSRTVQLTVFDANNQSSVATTTITANAPVVNTPPTAAITASASSGTAPVAITFNGSGSTAGSSAIASYTWSFGDGSTASGATASHSFASAGTFTTTLTVTDSKGLTSSASTAITVAAPVVLTPPTAVVATSTAAGPAPLAVTFDGTGSKAASGSTIASYAWSFGDGASASGATASHSFTSAGTYTATLTVTDSKGLTSSASTPIVVSAPIIINKAPSAVITATPTSGTSPLTATFDGSGSTDSDGNIASYIWNFGDGSTASGKTASHTYTTKATFTATLTVTDNKGSNNTTSTIINVQDEPLTAEIEMGEIAVTGSWVRVPINNTFVNPIVVAGPPSFNDAAPCAVRVRNVTPTGFEIRVAEWDYLDGVHKSETVRYLVMEKGRTTLPDGSIVEAGSFSGTTSFKTIAFAGSFAKVPVIVTTVVTVNESDGISGRIKNIGLKSFAYYFREQEKNMNVHANETVHYIAWEPGKGTIGSMQYEVGTTGRSVTNAWFTKNYTTAFNQVPLLLADMQTTNSTDTSALRLQANTASNFIVKVEEEQSKDSEVTHAAETVGYIAINQLTPSDYTIWPSDAVPTTVDAGSDGAQELGVKFRSDLNGYITGIRFYKAAANTGTHVANLWTSTGMLLATATFTNETQSGWQEVAFAKPVPITANTVYVASYFCPAGHQSVDRNYFESKGMDSAPLHALASGVSGANGVYAYGSSSVFPNSSYLNTNYWVDVVFEQ